MTRQGLRERYDRASALGHAARVPGVTYEAWLECHAVTCEDLADELEDKVEALEAKVADLEARLNERS